MARRQPKEQIRWQVQQEYYNEAGEWIIDPYPVVYGTEADAEACKERIATADPRECGDWLQPDAVLYVTDCICSF